MKDKTLQLLRRYESRNVTFMATDNSWPIVWEKASGVTVWDTSGRRYLDLTAAFGVAAAGHANRAVVRAGRRQMGQLLHAMGDVHPHPRKGELAAALSRLTHGRWTGGDAKTIFGNSGFEAIEAALKTAALATNKHRILAFENAYHGLGYGALNATYRAHFRSPFRRQIREFGTFLPFPKTEADLGPLEALLEKSMREEEIGAVLVEPVQCRGGIHVPPPGFLPLLRQACDRHHALLIADEIYTGFGRTGKWFACEHAHVVPDVICLGKALTGGFPLSACVGRTDLMDQAWPASNGEAIHTSTYLGHPVGCAMALAQIEEVRPLISAAARTGKFLLQRLDKIPDTPRFKFEARGLGLMCGIEITDRKGKPGTSVALRIVHQMLQRGFILLPEGEHANVISLTPPLNISATQLERCLAALDRIIREICA